MLIAFEHRQLLLVVIVAAIEVIIVASGVVDWRELVLLHFLDSGCRQGLTQFAHIFAIGGEILLFFGGKSVQTHVLQFACSLGIVEGIGERGFARHLTPNGLLDVGIVAVIRQSVLITFESVFEHILAQFAEVEIEVSAFFVIGFFVEEGVEHPELYVFDIRKFEIGLVEFAHNTTPSVFGVGKCAVAIQSLGIEVIRATLIGIV